MPHDEEKDGQVNFTEKTRAQLLASFGSKLTTPLLPSYNTIRIMRKHPTLALARSAVVAPIMAGSWGVEASDELKEDEKLAEERIKFIKDMFFPLRSRIVESSGFGGVDFGNQPFELVYEEEDGKIIISKAKPLLQDITTIKIDAKTGAFAGYEQSSTSGQPVILEPKYCLHIPFRVEGTQWHGQSLMENARRTYNWWNEAAEGAERYDAKIAGSHYAIYFPMGTSVVNGVDTPNDEIADTVLCALESSGSVTVPLGIVAFAAELNNNPSWKIEILEDKGSRQPGFTDRLNYLDKLLVRALLVPERSVLEGMFGTKAEAGVHADLAVTTVQLWDRGIVELVNHFAVNRVLEMNFGKAAKGSVWLSATPLVDAQLAFLQLVYLAILNDPATMLEEFGGVNTDGLKDQLGIPKSEEVAQAGETDDGEAPPMGLALVQRIKMLGKSLA